jgi:hypothetical protein
MERKKISDGPDGSQEMSVGKTRVASKKARQKTIARHNRLKRYFNERLGEVKLLSECGVSSPEEEKEQKSGKEKDF